jgi:hypothetical protein
MKFKIILKLINIITGFCETIDGIGRVVSFGFLNLNICMKWLFFISKKICNYRIKNRLN